MRTAGRDRNRVSGHFSLSPGTLSEKFLREGRLDLAAGEGEWDVRARCGRRDSSYGTILRFEASYGILADSHSVWRSTCVSGGERRKKKRGRSTVADLPACLSGPRKSPKSTTEQMVEEGKEEEE
jgi:hypothetical protein